MSKPYYNIGGTSQSEFVIRVGSDGIAKLRYIHDGVDEADLAFAAPDATSDKELQLFGGAWVTDFDDSEPTRGVRLGGAYLALESTDISLQLHSAQVGCRVVVAGLTERGNALLAVEAPPTPDYIENVTNSVDVTIYSAGSLPSAWVNVCDLLTITQDIDADEATVFFELLVENTGTKDGVFEIGISLNGAAPTAANSIQYPLSAGIEQIYANTSINANSLPDGTTARLQARGISAQAIGFSVVARNSERPSRLKVSVVGTGGGAIGGNPTASVGLTAVNGTALTWLRSDAAPALSQTISPTWSGDHTFNGTVDLAGLLKASGSEGAVGQMLASQGAGLPAVWRSSGGGSIDMVFKFNTGTAGTDPGNQAFNLNSATYSAVTSIGFDVLTVANFDSSTILGLLVLGNRIYIQQINDANRAVVYQVTAPATNNTGWWSVPVSFINTTLAATLFSNNANCQCVFILSTSNPGGANPTGTVGLTAVNGTSTNFIRSDGAPALSQSIAPTWSATHTFSLTPVVPNDSWTYAKIQNVSATSRVLGRITSGAGDIEELTGANLATIIGTSLGANPTASVGLAAVNGSAGTYMRSDAAPALAQGISPTWTGSHFFNGAVTLFNSSTSLSVGNTAIVQQFGTTVQASGHSLTRGSADNAGPRFAFAKTRSTSYDGLTAVQADDILGALSWFGADGTNLNTLAGQILGEVSTTVSTAVVPGRLRISTASATGVNTERIRFIHTGAIGLAGANYGTSGQVFTSGGSAAAPSWTNPALVAANFANPSATIGLAAVNGSAITGMRSDGAPALSQSIAPSWSAAHTFTLAGTASGTSAAIVLSSTQPNLLFRDTDAGTDAKVWRLVGSGNTWQFNLQSDDGSASKDVLIITRAANVLSDIALGNTTDNNTFTFSGTGVVTFNGLITTAGAGAQRATINSTHASGPYITFQRSGTSFSDIGMGGQMGGGYSTDSLAMVARTGYLLQFGANGGGPHFTIETTGITKIVDPGGTMEMVGYRRVPRSTTTTTVAIGDIGKCIAITAAINIPISVFSAGDAVSLYNDSGSAVNITISAGTLRKSGTATTGTLSLAQRGMVTLWFNVGGATPEVVAMGDV